MFCSNCGTQIPNESNFCWKCGKPQRKDAETHQEPQWETCEIMWNETATSFTGNNKGYFSAEAINPHGKYTAHKTKEFNLGITGHLPYSDHRDHWDIHKTFVDLLLKEGWQATGDRGQQWWALRFRRRVEEQNFNVILGPHGKQFRIGEKYEIILLIQSLTGQKNPKALLPLVEQGGPVLKNTNKAIAEAAKERLEKLGAIVYLEKS